MNKNRRKQISLVVDRLNAIVSDLEMIKGDEEDYYDNIPENLQSSSRAESSEEAIDTMDDVLSSLEEARDKLEEAADLLGELM